MGNKKKIVSSKKGKEAKRRNFIAVSAQFRTSAGPMKTKKKNKKKKYKEDWSKEEGE